MFQAQAGRVFAEIFMTSDALDAEHADVERFADRTNSAPRSTDIVARPSTSTPS